MEWREEFSVGDEQFDNDHKLIFEMVARLKSANIEEISTEFLESLFDDLLEYTDDHFEREEKFMQDMGYPNTVEHHAKHATMEGELRRLVNRFSQGDKNIAQDVTQFLDGWWHQHILEDDMAYVDFANKNNR